MNFIIGGKIISSNKTYNNQKINTSNFRSNSVNILEDKNSKTISIIQLGQMQYGADEWKAYNPSVVYREKRKFLTNNYPKCEQPPSSGSPSISGYASFVFDTSSKSWTKVV